MEAKCRTKNIVYKCIVWTYDQPDKAHSGTAGRYFSKDVVTTSALSKLRHK